LQYPMEISASIPDRVRSYGQCKRDMPPGSNNAVPGWDGSGIYGQRQRPKGSNNGTRRQAADLARGLGNGPAAPQKMPRPQLKTTTSILEAFPKTNGPPAHNRTRRKRPTTPKRTHAGSLHTFRRAWDPRSMLPP